MIDVLSKANTQALKGFAAIGIFVFHVLLAYQISPAFNMWGGLFVAVFLILSGYGIEESYSHNGLEGYWSKRLNKVILPTAFFICAYNFLFPYFHPSVCLSPGTSMHLCLDELLYIKPTFWFVFFILKCYTVYWIGTRYMSERFRLPFFIGCAFVCLNTQAPCGHLEAEQSFSFLTGVLISKNKHRLNALSDIDVRKYMCLLLFVGLFFFCLKSIPQLHVLKGSIAYNYLLCPFRLTTGLAFIPLLSMLRIGNSSMMKSAGKYSLEIYIAHIPFIGMIADARSTLIFFGYSTIGFGLLLLYRSFIEKNLNTVETLFVIINVLFVAKYSTRISECVCLVSSLLMLVFYYVLLRFVIPYLYKFNSKVLINGCVFAFLGMLAMQYVVDPYAIMVDRWSALHFPIQNLLSGIYPYTANTHLGGNASPFPLWQIFHIPFYLMGNVGLSFFVTMALFLWSCYKVQGRERTLTICVLLCSSIAVWYEVAVRSDLITNFLLLAAIINFFIHRMDQQWIEAKCLWIACAVGLLACTRILTLIPIALLLFPYFIKMRLRKQLAVLILSLTVFVLTFVPFVLWDWHEFFFFQNNPWSLQTRQGNLSDFCLFIPIAILLAMNHKSNAKLYYRNSALMLVIFVCITFIHNMYLVENWDLFSPTYDITYFSTALPFCLLAIAEKKRDKS